MCISSQSNCITAPPYRKWVPIINTDLCALAQLVPSVMSQLPALVSNLSLKSLTSTHEAAPGSAVRLCGARPQDLRSSRKRAETRPSQPSVLGTEPFLTPTAVPLCTVCPSHHCYALPLRHLLTCSSCGHGSGTCLPPHPRPAAISGDFTGHTHWAPGCHCLHLFHPLITLPLHIATHTPWTRCACDQHQHPLCLRKVQNPTPLSASSILFFHCKNSS